MIGGNTLGGLAPDPAIDTFVSVGAGHTWSTFGTTKGSRAKVIQAGGGFPRLRGTVTIRQTHQTKNRSIGDTIGGGILRAWSGAARPSIRTAACTRLGADLIAHMPETGAERAVVVRDA